MQHADHVPESSVSSALEALGFRVGVRFLGGTTLSLLTLRPQKSRRAHERDLHVREYHGAQGIRLVPLPTKLYRIEPSPRAG